jgi:hypothetical protein
MPFQNQSSSQTSQCPTQLDEHFDNSKFRAARATGYVIYDVAYHSEWVAWFETTDHYINRRTQESPTGYVIPKWLPKHRPSPVWKVFDIIANKNNGFLKSECSNCHGVLDLGAEKNNGVTSLARHLKSGKCREIGGGQATLTQMATNKVCQAI